MGVARANPKPSFLPALLQYYCTSIAQYTTPPPPPLVYAIQDTILVKTIPWNDQVGLSKPGGGNVTEPGVVPTPSG